MSRRPGRGAAKVAHFVFLALWVGGAVALLPLLASVNLSDGSAALRTYLHARDIAWNVIGWGGIGSVASGISLLFLSPWHPLRHRWVLAKLIAAPAMVLWEMFFVETEDPRKSRGP